MKGEDDDEQQTAMLRGVVKKGRDLEGEGDEREVGERKEGQGEKEREEEAMGHGLKRKEGFLYMKKGGLFRRSKGRL